MHFTRQRDLVVAGLVGAVAGYLLFELAFGDLPSLPLTAGAVLGILALFELVAAFRVRDRVRGGRVTEPVLVARFVVLAKASSMLGALMFGLWLGAIGYLAPRSGQNVAANEDLPGAIVGALCAAALIGAGLWLEYCCRTPDRPGGEGDEE